MIEKTGWSHPILGLRRRFARAAAWYRSARTTFEVVRLLDRETHLRSSRPSSRHHRPFVAHTGFIV